MKNITNHSGIILNIFVYTKRDHTGRTNIFNKVNNSILHAPAVLFCFALIQTRNRFN